jgi:hypothetical protein
MCNPNFVAISIFMKEKYFKKCNDRWDAVIGQIGVVSHHLQSLLGAIELTTLCAFIYRVGYFDAQIRETLLYK